MDTIYIEKELNILFGIKNNYTYTIQQKKGTSLFNLIFYVSDEPQKILPFIDAYREDHPEIGGSYRFDGAKLIIPLDHRVMHNAPQLEMILEAISFELYSEAYIERCERSGQTEDCHLYRIEDSVEFLNKAVYQALVEKQEYIAKHRDISLKQVGFAALGLVAGGMLYILFAQLRFISGIAGIAFFGFSLYGFKKAGGAPTVKRIYILMILSVLALILTEYASTVYRVVSYVKASYPSYPTMLAIRESMSLILTNTDFLAQMVFNISLALLLSVLFYKSKITKEIKKARRGFLSYRIEFKQEDL